MGLINVNGSYFSDEEPVLFSANRSYRYGDGLFETLKVINSTIALKEFHFDRLFAGFKKLEIVFPGDLDRQFIENEMLMLCEKNGMTDSRIRFSVWSGEGALNNPNRNFNYLIECDPLVSNDQLLNSEGLTLGLFDEGRKAIDSFSNLKSASFLIYAMASQKANHNKWDNCIVLNSNDGIADTMNANIFIIKNEKIYTPSLHDGCVAGVMRRFILEKLGKEFTIIESSLSVKDIEQADEIFLTNAIRNIQWVKKFNETYYSNQLIQKLFDRFIKLYKEQTAKI